MDFREGRNISCTTNAIAASNLLATPPLLGDISTSASVTSNNAILINSNGFRARACPNSVYTPNGTDVDNSSITQIDVNVVSYIDDLSDNGKTAIADHWGNRYPNATYLSEATYSYNCHSYAWYSQNSSTNTYWINFPTAYYSSSDMSYERTYTPQIGDIICYFDLDAQEAYQNIHSGIVVGFSGEAANGVCGDANTVIVRSKWGMASLFEHKGDECPYTTGEDRDDEVRYYRPRTNASYTLSVTMSDLSISRIINSSGLIVKKYGMYELNVTDAGQYAITIASDKTLDNRLYNANMNLTSMTLSEYSAGSYTYIANLSAGRYYLRTAYASTTQSGTISINIAHEHTFEQWTYYNHNSHIGTCCCGAQTTRAHAVTLSEVVDYRAYCLGCGYYLDLREDIAITNRVNRVSVNGSYILPSGIVVLVEEDVEAYFAGTLVFYEKENLPAAG